MPVVAPVIAAARAKPRILCVDDEPNVLDGLSANLRRKFDVHTSPGPREALSLLEATAAPFAVIVSDMRMPAMNGAAFLALVRQKWPDSTRMLLTGQSDIDTAIAAVNQGQIFRFLSKPCPIDLLVEAIEAGVEQNRLITAERVLLEQTLQGSIKALTDILAIHSPLIFGRAARAKSHVTALAKDLGPGARWPVEVAAMLSPIGTVTLPPDTAEKFYEGKPLSAPEQDMVKRLPAVTEQLLANIPRLEPVRDILAHLESRFDGEGSPVKGADIPVGARMLKLVLDFDTLDSQGAPLALAMNTMRGRKGLYDPELLTSLAALLGSVKAQGMVQELPLARLRAGMTFVDDVRSVSGGLLVARGHEVTASLIERMRNFARNVEIKEPVRVQVPAHLQLAD